MNKINRLMLLLLVFVLFMIGCTSITVRPIGSEHNLKQVYIQKNPKVKVRDFVSVLEAGFDRHGINTKVYSGLIPDSGEYILTYTAFQSWDFAPYLSHAEIRVGNDEEDIGYAEYHLKGKGGLSLMKWKGTKAKMDPVIDELLKNY